MRNKYSSIFDFGFENKEGEIEIDENTTLVEEVDEEIDLSDEVVEE